MILDGSIHAHGIQKRLLDGPPIHMHLLIGLPIDFHVKEDRRKGGRNRSRGNYHILKQLHFLGIVTVGNAPVLIPVTMVNSGR